MKLKQLLAPSFFLIIMISATVCYSTKKISVEDALKKIPLKEQQQLSNFFESLIVHHLFGYTIFGEKPVSETCFSILPHSFEVTLLSNYDLIIRNGALVWQKHKHLFPLKNFILKFENNGDYISIIIINIPLFKRTVNDNIDLFKKILGEDTTPESLLRTILKQDSIYGDTIKRNEILTGILYGFGKQNAILYNRFIEISNAIKKGVLPPFKDSYDHSKSNLEPLHKNYIQRDRELKKEKQYSSWTVKPSAGFKDIQEELEFIVTKTRGINTTRLLYFVKQFELPGFLRDPDNEEGKQIMDNFIMTKKKLRQIYSSEEFLETTLKKLTGET